MNAWEIDDGWLTMKPEENEEDIPMLVDCDRIFVRHRGSDFGIVITEGSAHRSFVIQRGKRDGLSVVEPELEIRIDKDVRYLHIET